MFEDWKNDFWSFIAYIGLRPSLELSLDRINNDGNYEPGNVQWADAHMQRHNRTKEPNFKGEDNPFAKFTTEQIEDIKELYSSGLYSQRELGSKFNTSQSNIGRIVNNKSWRHVP